MNRAAPAERARTFTLILVGALLGVVFLWHWPAQPSPQRLLWVAVLTLPLWLPLRWLIRRSRRAYAAMTLCVTPYLILGITEAVANPHARPWATLCLSLALLLFIALVAYLRLSRRQA